MKLKSLTILYFVLVCWQASAQYSLPACSPAWNPSTTYAAGDRVSYQFSNYEVKWSTTATPGGDGWKFLGRCGEALGPNYSGSQRIIGYLPYWVSDFNYTTFDPGQVTHLNISFNLFQQNNNNYNSADFASIQFAAFHNKKVDSILFDLGILNKAHAKGTKVSVAIGGATDYAFLWLMTRYYNDDARMDQIATYIANYVNAKGIDGVDLDLECWWPDATISGTVEQGGKVRGTSWGGSADDTGPHAAGIGLTNLAQKLRQKMPSKLISAAVFGGAYYGNNYDDAMHQYMDWIGIMSYDFTGSWNESPIGPHSSLYKVPLATYERQSDANPIGSAVDALEYWMGMAAPAWNHDGGFNVPKAKLVTGVPMYGYDFSQRKPNNGNGYLFVPYRNIVASYPNAANSFDPKDSRNLQGYIGLDGKKLYYDTPKAAAEKIKYNKLFGHQGVIVWEMTQDAPYSGGSSIMKALNDEAGIVVNSPPTTSITSPANNATIAGPTNITINANAADTAPGTVSKVEFFNGNTKIGEDLSSPYSIVWTNVGAGTYALTSRATDNQGAVTTSATVNITVTGDVPPVVSITSPANNASFTAPANITISANASSSQAITRVEFYAGATKIGEDLTAPYSIAWSNVAAGSYSLTARMIAGATTNSSPVNITVNSTPPGIVTTYKDCNYTGTAVALPVGDYTLAQLNSRGILDNDMSSLRVTSGYQITLYDTDNFTGATLVVTADNACLVGAGWNDRTTSVRVSTTANPAPTTSITSPANGATFTAPASITINANAADTAPGTVSSVAFYNGSTLLSTDISSPYSFTWTNVASGTYSLTTRATDNQGATGTSVVVNITVNASGVVTTYKDCNYTGTAVSLPVGDYTLAQLNSRGILDNDMSSLRVTSGYQIALYDTDNFTGATLVVTADNSCLVAAGWNDRTTSARVSTTANPAPTTSITSPANGATFTAPASITINANASDTAPGTVSSVAFYNGSTLLSTDTSSPYSFTWTSVAAGTYSLTTRATDNQGATGTSAVVNITVNSSGVVTTYKDCNYTGTAVSLPVGDYTLAQLNSRGILNNDISSLRITSGYQITLYDTDNFTGATLVVTADDACLVAAGWNDRTTAARVAASTPSFSTTIQAENWLSMSGVQTEACSEGGLNVGWIETGDWMAYNVTIPATGTYSVIYRISSPNPNISLRLEKDNGTTQLGTVPVTNTGGWQNWQSVAHNVTLPAGTYPIGIATATGGFNINYFIITNNLSARSRTLDGSELEPVSEEESEFFLFPNPVQDQLYLGGVENAKRIKVYNMQGMEMISVENPGSSISVQSLTKGLHIVVVEKQNNRTVKQKFLKK